MLTYILIFLGKTTEMIINTIRIKVMSRGYKILGALFGMLEVTLWLVIVSTVVSNIQDDPIKAIFYVTGFGFGIYMGSLLEDKMAIGNIRVEIIVPKEDGEIIAKHLRDSGYAVTIIEGQGIDSVKDILILMSSRKTAIDIKNRVKEEYKNSFVSITDISSSVGGFWKKR